MVAVVDAKALTAVINEAAYPKPDLGDGQILKDARMENLAGVETEDSEKGVGHAVEMNW